MNFKEALLYAFPVPKFLSMPSVGIDISDSSIKFAEFIKNRKSLLLGKFGERAVPAGIVEAGEIKNPDSLVAILKKLRQDEKLSFVRASLPEEKGYLFELSLPNVKEDEIIGTLEFRLEENAPLSPSSAVFDYDIIEKESNKNINVAVSAFSISDVESYVEIFKKAGLTPLSFEIEAQAIARATVRKGDKKTYLVIDIGRARSGISIVSKGVVVFTTTIAIGGDMFTAAIKKQLGDKEDITNFKNTKGIKSTDNAELMRAVSSLKDEINKYSVYWHTHGKLKKEKAGEKGVSVNEIILCGGNANLAGLPEYLYSELGIKTRKADVWTNAFDTQNTIPDISFNRSLTFAPAVGLALHGLI